MLLFARPAPKLERRTESEHFSMKRWFWGVLSHYLPIYKHVIVASVIINIIGVAGSLFTMNVYDRVVPNNATATLWVLTSGILLAYFCDFLLRNLRGYFVDVAGRNADVVISSKLVDKVLSMRFDKKPESTGALVNNLREFEALRDFFSSGTLLTFVDLPFLILFLALTAFIGGPLVFVPLSAVPVMLIGGLWIQWAAPPPSTDSGRTCRKTRCWWKWSTALKPSRAAWRKTGCAASGNRLWALPPSLPPRRAAIPPWRPRCPPAWSSWSPWA